MQTKRLRYSIYANTPGLSIHLGFILTWESWRVIEMSEKIISRPGTSSPHAWKQSLNFRFFAQIIITYTMQTKTENELIRHFVNHKSHSDLPFLSILCMKSCKPIQYFMYPICVSGFIPWVNEFHLSTSLVLTPPGKMEHIWGMMIVKEKHLMANHVVKENL